MKLDIEVILSLVFLWSEGSKRSIWQLTNISDILSG